MLKHYRKMMPRNTPVNLPITVLMCSMLVACAGTTRAENICKNWSTNDGSGESVLWIPPDDKYQLLQTSLKPNRQIECIHRLPSGTIAVINSNGKTYNSTFKEVDGKLEFVREEFFLKKSYK